MPGAHTETAPAGHRPYGREAQCDAARPAVAARAGSPRLVRCELAATHSLLGLDRWPLFLCAECGAKFAARHPRAVLHEGLWDRSGR